MRGAYLAFSLLTILRFEYAFGWEFPKEDFCSKNTQLSFFLDKENRLSADDAFKSFATKVLVTTPQKINYGYTRGTVWLYLKVKKTDDWQKCIVELANPQLSYIDVFQITDGSTHPVVQMGDRQPFENRFYRLRNFVFPYRTDADKEFVLAIRSSATMTVPIKVQWRDQYVGDSSFDYLLLGFFYGLMVFFIFFGLHSFISFRNKGFLVYTFFAASMLLFFIDRDGIAFQYFWPNAVEWKIRSVRVLATVSMVLGVLYYSSILRIGPRTRTVACAYIGICVALGLALLLLDPAITNIPTIMASFGTPLMMIALPISAFRKDRIFAPYLLIGGLCSLAGLLLYSLCVTNVITSSAFAENAMKVTTILEFVFLSLGIHFKIRRSMRRKALHKAVFEISNMLAHDVRKPLDKMDKFLSRLEKLPKEQRDSYVRFAAPSIREDVKSADSMLHDLIAIGKEQAFRGEADLKPLISKICGDSYQVALNHNCYVKANADCVVRVLENIVENAQEATAGSVNCEYWVRTSENGRYVHLLIGNTGSAIAKDDLRQVFCLFFTKGKERGSGIGLAYVDHTIRGFGGAISVESNGWSSNGRRVQRVSESDYVEFHITLPKGGVYERQAVYSCN